MKKKDKDPKLKKKVKKETKKKSMVHKTDVKSYEIKLPFNRPKLSYLPDRSTM